MIQVKNCCSVPFPDKLSEQYQVFENYILANVGVKKSVEMMNAFINTHSDEPMFFILEIPTKLDDETENGELISDAFHEDVYFIDGLNVNDALDILSQLGDFLSQDGMNSFGFGGHKSHEEMLFGRYNVMTIYTKNADKYSYFFADFEIEKTDHLVTAYDTFSKENYGETWRLEKDGMTIFDIPKMFKNHGMYFYERRSKG